MLFYGFFIIAVSETENLSPSPHPKKNILDHTGFNPNIQFYPGINRGICGAYIYSHVSISVLSPLLLLQQQSHYLSDCPMVKKKIMHFLLIFVKLCLPVVELDCSRVLSDVPETYDTFI